MKKVDSMARDGSHRAMLAIVLAGGESRRMGGEDKLASALAGQMLLEHAVDAVSDADLIVAVGPHRQTRSELRWTREEPPGGGPVAAIAAGLSAADDVANESEFVAVLAGDMPFAGAGIDALIRAVGGTYCDVAIAVGEDGRDQPLLAMWRRLSLSTVLSSCDSTEGRSAQSLLTDVNVVRVPVADDVILDCDEQEDLEIIAAIMRGRDSG